MPLGERERERERERRHDGAGKPGVRKVKEKTLGATPVIKPTQFPIK
jgi:hypothetical protein